MTDSFTNAPLVLSHIKDDISIIELNRLERNNALNLALLRALNAVLHDAAENDAVKTIVLTSAGRLFSEGADLDEMAALGGYTEIKQADYLTGDFEYITRIKKPIIAAVMGYTLGGGLELALMCDIIIAADNVRLGLPEVQHGLMPGGGATQRLVSTVGKHKALELCLTGRTLRAAAALDLGLVNQVVKTSNLRVKALELAAAIAKHTLDSTQNIKAAIYNQAEVPLKDGLRAERDLFHSVLGHKNSQKEQNGS